MANQQNTKTEYEKLKKIAAQLQLEVRKGIDQKNELENELLASANDDADTARELDKLKEKLNLQRQDVSEQVEQLKQIKSDLETSLRDLSDKLGKVQTLESKQDVVDVSRDDSFDFQEEERRQHFLLEQAETEKQTNLENLSKLQKEQMNCQEKVLSLKHELDYFLGESEGKKQHINELSQQAENEEHELENIRVSLEGFGYNDTNKGIGDSLFSEVERNCNEVLKKLIDLVSYYKEAKQEKAKITVQLVRLKQVCLFLEASKENAEKNFFRCATLILGNLKNPKRSSLDNNANVQSTGPAVTQDTSQALQSACYMQPMITKIRKQIDDCEQQVFKEKKNQLELSLKQMQCCQKMFQEETQLLLLRCRNLKLKIQVTAKKNWCPE